MPLSPNRREAVRTLLSASLGALLPRSAQGLADLIPPAFAPARNLLAEATSNGTLRGAAAAVAHRGRIVWEEGFGWANREAGLKATAHTPFSLASITKPFTATTLVTLAAEGRLRLDDPANHYLASSRLIGISGQEAGPTVRSLGAHSSGLPTMYESFDLNERSLSLGPDALLRHYGKLAYPPGSCYEYSNLGFAALAAIASNLAGTDFGSLVQQRVLTPLHLHDSFFDTEAARLPSAAVRYDPLGRPIPFYTTSTPASGELYASAHDLALFAMWNLKHRTPEQASLLDDHWIDELHRPVFVGPSGVATTFGWFTARTNSGAPMLFKFGGQPGVATTLFLLPSEDLACTVLTNQSDGRKLCLQVCQQILGSVIPGWQPPEETSSPAVSPFRTGPHLGGRWQGILQNDGAHTEITLHIGSSNAATLALGNRPPQPVSALQLEGPAVTGTATGSIDSPDAQRTAAHTLRFKLLPHREKLVGRILATSGDPNVKNIMLPFVVTLHRVTL